VNCNTTNTNTAAPDVPPTIVKYAGYYASVTHGDTDKTSNMRGMFCRGGAIVRAADVTDGLSHTLLLGEILAEFSEFQRYNTTKKNTGHGWAGYNSVAQGQTIQPINWPIDPVPVDAPWGGCGNANNPSGPDHCLFNWSVTWGFRSNHPGGVNFALADGSVIFISEKIDHQTYQYLGCRHDGQPVFPP
jgi:prepilin-type processing-associated H-X9-DG protein